MFSCFELAKHCLTLNFGLHAAEELYLINLEVLSIWGWGVEREDGG